MINSLQITCEYDTSYKFGSVKYCMDLFFSNQNKKKSICSDKKINIKKKFPLNKQFTNFYSYHNLIQEKYKQYVYDDHKLI